MTKLDSLWAGAMAACASSCHQRADRSFFLGSYQLPVCSRCVGVLAGQLAFFTHACCAHVWSLKVNILLLATMGVDYGLQRMCLVESTNVRRLLTGMAGGYGFWGILGSIAGSVVHWLPSF